MNTLVVDVSVAAKWLLPARDEPLAAEALQLLHSFKHKEISFIVPDLFWAELANVLGKAVTRRRCSLQEAASHLAETQILQIPSFPSAAFVGAALALAVEYNRTAYDSFYLALAVETNTTLITADERLAKAVAAYLPVRWLGAVY